MHHHRCHVPSLGVLLLLLYGVSCVAPPLSLAHPLGNFSISHYAGLRIGQGVLELRYLIDMAEIPTFLEIQESGIVPETSHPSVRGYLDRQTAILQAGLRVEVNGQRLALQGVSSEIVFPPGAGDLPTLKLGIVYQAPLEAQCIDAPCHLHYQDTNFPGRLGWQEIIATVDPGLTVVQSSVPTLDRSRALTEYPPELLRNPPQVLEAEIRFRQEALPSMTTPTGTLQPVVDRMLGTVPLPTSPRSAFTDLVTTQQLSFGMVCLALTVAVGLGALHALEPGHGKTLVAAYLVGTRGTLRHAFYLGMIVTATHTAGVYLLGAITLSLSHYVIPERLYPWLGSISGVIITVLGCRLLLQRYAHASHAHSHTDGHVHSHAHGHVHHYAHAHHHTASQAHETVPHDHPPLHEEAHPQPAMETISPRALLALGMTGGMVPCPAALVVLLSAMAMHRVGFGLLLIVAFSVGLAGVLIVVGLLMVSARQVLARFQQEGRLMTRWLPLVSAAVITVFGVGMIVQTLVTAGVLQIRL